MGFRLAIAPIVEFVVRLAYTEGGGGKVATFSLFAKRMDAAELAALRGDNERTVADVLCEQVTGWRDQALVLDEAGAPAAYSAEALRTMLALPGAANAIFADYVRAIGVEGKRGN